VITHVAAFTWREGVTDDQIAAVEAGLATLPARIPSLASYRFGRDAGLSAGNADFAVVASFDDVDGWRAYDTDPEHSRIRAEIIKPLIAQRAALQFES
jgi:hypothetical protein